MSKQYSPKNGISAKRETFSLYRYVNMSHTPTGPNFSLQNCVIRWGFSDV